MHESLKAVCVLVFIVASCVAAVAIFHDMPDATVWATRIIASALALLSLASVLLLLYRRDRAPDFLRQTCGGYFDRGGFCFAIVLVTMDHRCYLRLFFQNRYERPCRGRVALQPASGFLRRPNFQGITIDVECPAGGFGMSELPLPIPKKFQGKRQTFEVGASVEYPDGKGRMLRFAPGAVLRSNANFGNPFHAALTIAGALAGSFVISRPATVAIEFPTNVAEEMAEQEVGQSCILWQLGDGQELSPRAMTSIEQPDAIGPPPDPNNPYSPPQREY
jgi:hypothetical protein